MFIYVYMYVFICICVYAGMHVCMFICMWIMGKEEELLRRWGNVESIGIPVIINQGGALTKRKEPEGRGPRGRELIRTTCKYEDATMSPIALNANSKFKKKERK